MMNCPKCDFLQPEDQYCARCGVDVINYKAPEASTFHKLMKSPFAYLAIIFALSVSTWFYIQNNEKSEMADRVRFLKGELSSTQLNSPEPTTLLAASTELSDSADSVNNESSESTTPIEESTLNKESHSVNSDSAPETSPKETLAATTDKTKSIKLKIEYAEVSLMALQRLYDESKMTNQFVSFGDYSVGLLPQLNSRLSPYKSNSNLKVYESKDQLTKANHSTTWFIGNKNEETDFEFGITTVITISEAEDDVIRGEIEIIRSIREGPDKQSAPLKRSFPAQFELTKETGMYISQILPHRPPSDLEDELLGTNLFQIYQSPRFQNRNSEFVVFLHWVP